MRCPDCPPVRAARELAVDDLWQNFALAILPFAVVIAVVLLVRHHLEKGER
jgi:hypothetical protein